jgi:hypothetical protein
MLFYVIFYATGWITSDWYITAAAHSSERLKSIGTAFSVSLLMFCGI